MSVLEQIDIIIAVSTIEHRDNYIPLNEVIEYQIAQLLKSELED